MTDVHDPASLLEAAEKAVAADDYPTAERLLRAAATSQEATLGPRHADLAATLNNLALVCERTNKLEDAERGYRRAHAIAVASLGPGDPFVRTSLRNLVAFCSTHNIPLWKPPAVVADDGAPPEAADAAEADAGDAVLEFEAEAKAQGADTVSPVAQENEPPQPVHRAVPGGIAAAALGVVAVAVLAFVAWRGTTGTVAPSPEITPSVGNESPAPAASAPVPAREPEPAREPAPEPETVLDERPVPPSAAVEPPPTPGPGVAAAQVTVLRAQLCSALERTGSPDWQCTPASGDLGPAAYTFYTRLLTDADTTVEHRWYRGDRLHQTMRLRVAPSPGSGYRTYSRNTVSPERTGDWRVELRAADGTLLREEQFVVR